MSDSSDDTNGSTSPASLVKPQQSYSKEMWEQHRQTITKLYLDEKKRLEDVRTIMSDKHDFSPTRKMYYNHINEWGINKKMTKSQKAALEERLSGGDNLSGPERYRLSRAKKYQKQKKSQRAASAREGEEHSEILYGGGRGEEPFTFADHRGSSGLVDHPSEASSVGASSSNPFANWDSLKAPSTLDYTWPQEEVIGTSINLGLTGLSLSSNTVTPKTRLVEPAYSAYSSGRPPTSTNPISPSPSLGLSLSTPGTPDMEILFRCIKVCCQSSLQPLTSLYSRTDSNPASMSALVKPAWDNLKNCLYLFKINDLRRAQVAIEKFLSLQAEQVIEPTISFLLAILSNLSPTNTPWNHPQLRLKLLSHLRAMAVTLLKPNHPITLILKELQLGNPDPNFSENALVVLADCLSSNKNNILSLHIRLQTAKLTRRKGNLAEAMQQLSALELQCQKSQQPSRPSPHNQQLSSHENLLRDIHSEQSHIHVAHAKSLLINHPGPHHQLNPTSPVYTHLTTALTISRSILGAFVLLPGLQGYAHHDARAIHAMEDIAEIHALMGDNRECTTMLEHAADVAVSEWGLSVATTHVLDKCAVAVRERAAVQERDGDADAQGEGEGEERFRARYARYLGE